MTGFYKFISSLAALAVVPLFTAYALITGKKRRGLAHHFGVIPQIPKNDSQKTVWLHALSLGEVNAAAPVLKRLRKEAPELQLVVSVTTDSGYDGAQKHLKFVDQIIFHPIDCWPFLTLAVAGIRPNLFILTDTGFWPGLILMLKEKGVPQIVFNGRVSERSYQKYRKVRVLVRHLMQAFAVICMQNDRGKTSMQKLGARAGQMRVIGDTKYDMLKPVLDPERTRIREEMKIPASHPVWVAGSTHAGEESIILEAFKKLKTRHPQLTLVLAPRRLERIPKLMRLLEHQQLKFVLRSEVSPSASHSDSIVLLDTLGELAQVYAIADVTFVGRSLIAPGGGHSLIEPASHGKLVLHGPYIENFTETADQLHRHGVAAVVHNAHDLEQRINALLGDSIKMAQIEQKASALIETQKGASRQMVEIILHQLNTSA